MALCIQSGNMKWLPLFVYIINMHLVREIVLYSRLVANCSDIAKDSLIERFLLDLSIRVSNNLHFLLLVYVSLLLKYYKIG